MGACSTGLTSSETDFVFSADVGAIGIVGVE
jgi:hypothetical protein